VPESGRSPCRKRNLWVLVPGARPRALGLHLQPPPEALYWTLEGDSAWHPMPAAGAARQGAPLPPPRRRRGKRHPAPDQRTLWQAGAVEPAAQPCLRYPGGKRYLLPRLQSLLADFPCHDHDYLEPMIGGGAVYWKFGGQFRTRVIGDKSPDLVTLYRVLRNDVERLIDELQSGAYEYLGKSDPASLARFKSHLNSEPNTQVQRAARYLYINKACWGGMMRWDHGRLKASPNLCEAPTICDSPRLRACAAALQGTQILRGSAHQVIAQARAAHPDRKFLIVLDPPYDDPEKRFVEYAGAFTRRDQADLALAVLATGYKFIYTNKATDFILGLFAQAQGIERITLPLRHKLGSKGPLETELLVHNLVR
jgi:DNA adenine methylase Dam